MTVSFQTCSYYLSRPAGQSTPHYSMSFFASFQMSAAGMCTIELVANTGELKALVLLRTVNISHPMSRCWSSLILCPRNLAKKKRTQAVTVSPRGEPVIFVSLKKGRRSEAKAPMGLQFERRHPISLSSDHLTLSQPSRPSRTYYYQCSIAFLHPVQAFASHWLVVAMC